MIGQEMFGQEQAEMFRRFDAMLSGKGVHGVFHRVGRQNLAVIAFGVRGFELAF